MVINNFDPTKYGATPFNPEKYGATPVEEPEIQPEQKPSFLSFLGKSFIAPYQAIAEANIGGLKGVGSTLTGLGQLPLKALSRLPLPQKAQEVIQGGIRTGEELKQTIFKPKTPMETVGKTAEQIAEYMIPTGLGVKGSLLRKSLETGLEFGGKTILQKGGNLKEAKRAAIIGLLTPPAVQLVSGTVKFLTKTVPEKLYSQIFKSAEDDLMKYYKTVARGQEIDPTLAKELLDRGLKGNSENMAVYSIKKLDELEGAVQETIKAKQWGETINLSNKEGYKNILQTTINQFKSGFLSSRAKEAEKLLFKLNSISGQKVDLELALKLRRFIDQMRNTSSFRLDPKLTPRQEEFKLAADYLRRQLANAGLKDLMNEERIFIQALDSIVGDAAKRMNTKILNLTDILVGGGGIAGGFPGTGIGAAFTIRGFQQPISLTNIAQVLNKGGKAIETILPFLQYSIPRSLPNLIPSIKK